MSTITSINEIDLAPTPGKKYFNTDREWREEFIYFLLVDRFHDDIVRTPAPTTGRTSGFNAPDTFYGGKIKGITSSLEYIARLGCTAIWVSPVFENNANAYHGYDIKNYLQIDPHFGTKEDLKELVSAAHSFMLDGNPHPIRIILDVVINHSGNNWFYKFQDLPGTGDYRYFNDEVFDFGGWRSPDYPVPVELRNPDLYHRRGIMSGPGFDSYPENQHGDMFGLKDYANDDDKNGSTLINILIKSHCYWIKEADIDGFRVDAVKHMGELACARFCSNIREYAYSLGKRNFFLFGELAVSSDDIYNRYIGQNTSDMDGDKQVFYGINSLLDFRLAQGDGNNAPLRDVIKGQQGPQTLINRLAAQEHQALNRGEIGRYLVSFIDNHDAFWQPQGRLAATANDRQVIAGIGYLLCSLGTPCIYYGTEQGFDGSGGDLNMREAMFDKSDPAINCMNSASFIYQEIAKIASVMRTQNPLRFGRMYFREISGNGHDFGLPFGTSYTLAFSRLLYGQEVLVAYNVSDQARQDCVLIESAYHQAGQQMQYLYGGSGSVTIEAKAGGSLFVKIPLNAHQFVILH